LIWRRGFNLVHIILLVANCLLLVAIFHVWWGDEAAPVKSRSSKGPEVPRTPVLRDQQALNAFRIVSTKNLFSQDRTGPDLGGAVAKAPSSLEGKKLLGTMIIGEERVALIGSAKKSVGPIRPGRPVGPAAPEIDVVHLGEQWEGFKVVDISSEAVIFQSKEGKQTLNFPED
jgi:hypothetical protein